VEVLESTTYGTNEPLGDTGNINVLRMNNIRQGEIDWSEVKRAELSESELNDLDLRSSDILFNRTNSLDLVGKIGMVRDMPEAASFASYLVRLRTKARRARPAWLAALLGSSMYQSRIRRFATPGVSQANINPTNLKALLVPLPGLDEQKAVVELLDGLLVHRACQRRQRDTLGIVKTAIVDELLTGRVKAQRRLTAPSGE
jgi:type I restriction enzyme S subunit